MANSLNTNHLLFRIMKILVVLACLIMVVPAVNAGPSANARADLVPDAPPAAIALSADGTVLAVGAEAPGEFPLNPGATKWAIYDILEEHYNKLQWGSVSEGEVCTNSLSAPGEEYCLTAPTDLSISGDGQRMLVSAVRGDGTSLILVVSPATGMTASLEVNRSIHDVELAADGRTAIAASTNSADLGNVAYHLSINGAGTDIQAAEVALEEAPIRIDMTSDGAYALVMSERGIELLQGEESIYFNALGDDVAGAAISDASPYRFVAATGTGLLRVYEAFDSSQGHLRLNVPPSGAGLTTLALDPDGSHLVVARSNGQMDLLKVFEDSTHFEALASATLSQPADEILFSRDGQTLLTASGSHLAQFDYDFGLYRLWDVTFDAPIDAVAMDSSGNRIAAASNMSVRLFEADHDLQVAGDDRIELSPGKQTAVALTFSNNGNRVERFSWNATSGQDWLSGDAHGNAVIPPGGSQNILLQVDVPLATAPQEVDFIISTSTGINKSISGEVPEVKVFDWVFGGPEAEVSVETGSLSSWSAMLRNIGNVPAKPVVRLQSETPGWSADIVQAPSTLEPGAQGKVQITMTAPHDALHLDEGVFQVEGGGSGLLLRGIIGAEFDLDINGPLARSIDFDSPTTLTFSVSNFGNVHEDVIVQAKDVPEGWTVVFQQGERMRLAGLSPGSDGQVEVTITAADGATDRGFITLEAKSTTHAGTISSHVLALHNSSDSRSIPTLPTALLLVLVLVAVLAVRRKLH